MHLFLVEKSIKTLYQMKTTNVVGSRIGSCFMFALFYVFGKGMNVFWLDEECL